MDNNIDIQKQISETRLKNVEELKLAILSIEENKDLMVKISNYADRYQLPVSFVIDKLLSDDDDMVLYGFEKDPAKQNIYEKLQLEAVKKLPVISGATKLSSGGKDARYVVNGKVVSLTKKEREERNIKSIDLYWFYEFNGKKIQFYSSCKHTNESGGAQDNQKNDVVSFLKEAQKAEDNDIFFVAIVDGEYYDDKKMKALQESFTGNRCAVTHMEQLNCVLANVIEEWLLSLSSVDTKDEIKEIKRKLLNK